METINASIKIKVPVVHCSGLTLARHPPKPLSCSPLQLNSGEKIKLKVNGLR